MMGVCGFCINNFNHGVCIPSLYDGIDWLFTAVEAVYMYDFEILYSWLLYCICGDSIDLFFSSIWYITLNLSSFNLF
jgi:hypothetical protein